jgi:outer membrane biosynthesis protein TonB
MPDQADAILTSEPPPKQSREEKRLARIAAADARNKAKAPAKKAAAPKKKPPRAPTPARRPSPKPKPTPAREPVSAQNKTDLLIGMMSRPEGATSKAMEEAASWQPHSVRGLIGTLKAKRGMNIVSSKDKGQPTVYRIPAQAGRAAAAEVGDVI